MAWFYPKKKKKDNYVYAQPRGYLKLVRHGHDGKGPYKKTTTLRRDEWGRDRVRKYKKRYQKY